MPTKHTCLMRNTPLELKLTIRRLVCTTLCYSWVGHCHPLNFIPCHATHKATQRHFSANLYGELCYFLCMNILKPFIIVFQLLKLYSWWITLPFHRFQELALSHRGFRKAPKIEVDCFSRRHFHASSLRIVKRRFLPSHRFVPLNAW